ncbi:DUF2321 domain-containing protein [Kosmotoga pacifica]|uniref:DUF2321 domain-containing protein n=1 Tax=Kosmotoga pacifica TaxID=1330330 RepID=A0A0G2ZGW2_9BACT|nr:DUF2321 domain-containing protein [Kosmotoga pacifica]AKI97988.1 hypothetical protein IX53_09305 [Kosmotoga pacifica]
MGTYHKALICKNGHIITDTIDTQPEKYEKYCSKCGAETIKKCEHCGAFIRGDYEIPGFVTIGFPPELPKYCHNCGKPYPWTEKSIEAAKELLMELDSGYGEDFLNKTVEDLISDDPETKVAIVRIKKMLAKASPEIGKLLKDILVGVVSEGVRKMIWGA